MSDDRRAHIGPWGGWLVAVALAAALAVAIDAMLRVRSANDDLNKSQASTVSAMGLIPSATKSLDSRFSDRQGRLLADPPESADQLLDPQTIVMAHLDSSDPETPNINWQDFEAHLADVTGRHVEDQPFDNGPDQLSAIADGKITLVALHGADAPFLVNHFGYQPVAVLGNDGGANGNHLDILVPHNSAISQLDDLRGHALVCTLPSSVTGYRAAVTLLMEKAGLRPNVDYSVIFSLKQTVSIEGVAKGDYEAAAVSDDKLQTLLQAGSVSAAGYKQIYQSEVIPRTTIGWFYNLKPELADKVRQAILSYQPKPDPEADPTAKPLHFIAVDYRKDFQTIREIDDRFDPRLDSKTKNTKTPAATEPADTGL